MTTTLEKTSHEKPDTDAPADQLALDLPLTEREANQLSRCETVIRQGLRAFLTVGMALNNIRDNRLYRQTHKTFEDYCEKTFDLRRSSAYRLMSAVEVIGNLSPIGDSDAQIPLPQNEAQARPLAALPAEEQPAAWARAQEIAGGEAMTAAAVQQAVDEFRPPVLKAEAGDDATEQRTLFGAGDVPAEPVAHVPPGPVFAGEVTALAPGGDTTTEEVDGEGNATEMDGTADDEADDGADATADAAHAKTRPSATLAAPASAPVAPAAKADPAKQHPAPAPVAAKPMAQAAPAPPALPAGFTTAVVKVEDFRRAQEMGLWPPAAAIAYVEELEAKAASSAERENGLLVLINESEGNDKSPSPALALAVGVAGQLAEANRTTGSAVLTSPETEILDELFWDRPETLPEHIMAVILSKRLRLVNADKDTNADKGTADAAA